MYFKDCIFSRHDLPRSKPSPDIYLAAGANLRADPAPCLVIEDTTTGVRAGLDVGATDWGCCPAGYGLTVARVFRHMDELVMALVG